MDRYISKENFLKWIDGEKLYARKELDEIRAKNKDTGVEPYTLETVKEIHDMGYIAHDLNIEFIKIRISDEVFDYLSSYSIDIDVLSLDSFIRTIEDINYFKKSKLSIDGKEYRREIEQLKAKADSLQFYSEKSIEIKLPILPHVSIYFMIKYLEARGYSKETIKILNSFFDGRMRLPRKNVSIGVEEFKIKYAADLLAESLKTGFYQRNTNMMNTIMAETIDYYIPDINLSYERKLSRK